MTQPLLFDDLHREPQAKPAVAHPMARTSDPESSHLAAQKTEAAAKRHRARVVDFVFRWPGKTSKELAELEAATWAEDLLGRHEIARRLPEAQREGHVASRPGEDGGRELRWYPV